MTDAAMTVWTDIHDRLMRFALRYTKDKAVAQDIVQDVFLKVHDHRSQLQQKDKPVGWIFRIAKHTIIDHFRRNQRKLSVQDLDWEGSAITLNDCVSACLEEMIHTLPPKYRDALVLSDLKGMSQLTIAQTLKMSYSGAKSRIQRARQILRDKMNAAYHLEFDRYGNAIRCENALPCGCQ